MVLSRCEKLFAWWLWRRRQRIQRCRRFGVRPINRCGRQHGVYNHLKPDFSNIIAGRGCPHTIKKCCPHARLVALPDSSRLVVSVKSPIGNEDKATLFFRSAHQLCVAVYFSLQLF
ncbi:hypothetical protein PoB_004705500 [Plakobranchus ocellatus]|uniref:Uncharacterized protein n=1 Tax=Plakobranchus ocellatus TaxID=259542 RepID=A0AAV4BNB8_9GAST|nr:hypothetical protein PoB_004705500 [Plakobranchus ocellatus]